MLCWHRILLNCFYASNTTIGARLACQLSYLFTIGEPYRYTCPIPTTLWLMTMACQNAFPYRMSPTWPEWRYDSSSLLFLSDQVQDGGRGQREKRIDGWTGKEIPWWWYPRNLADSPLLRLPVDAFSFQNKSPIKWWGQRIDMTKLEDDKITTQCRCWILFISFVVNGFILFQRLQTTKSYILYQFVLFPQLSGKPSRISL